MPNCEPEPWESGAAGPFLWIEDSPVEVWALGGFAVRAPGQERIVTGFEERRSHRRRLRWSRLCRPRRGIGRQDRQRSPVLSP
jgi:hypothetical protein